MVFSSHVWNVNFVPPLAMLHLATACAMRNRRTFWATFAHVLIIGLGVQLHTSAMVLAVLSVLLWATQTIRVHWGGIALAVGTTVVTLVPWITAVAENPTLLPKDEGFPLRGLLLVFPFARGVLYWLKDASLSFSTPMLQFDFTALFGRAPDSLLSPIAVTLVTLAHLTVLLPLWSTLRLGRWGWRTRRQVRRAPATSRLWLRRVAWLGFIASAVSFALSPTTVMYWQVLVVQHLAVITVILPLESLGRLHRTLLARATRWWAVATVILLLLVTAGAPLYRKGGRNPQHIRMLQDHRMFHAWGLADHSTVIVDASDQSAWWPIGLPLDNGAESGRERLP
jgi:hypothetical protein